MEYYRTLVQYQLNKLRDVREGIYPKYGDNIEAELFSFFIICYHLKDHIKDWVKYDPSYKSFNDVEKFINQSPPLRICADICNRLKHKTPSDKHKPRSKSELGIFILRSTSTIGP